MDVDDVKNPELQRYLEHAARLAVAMGIRMEYLIKEVFDRVGASTSISRLKFWRYWPTYLMHR